jgi:hypothetical protein
VTLATKRLIPNPLNRPGPGHDSRLIIQQNNYSMKTANKNKTFRSPTKTKRDRLSDKSMQEKGRMSPGKKQARQKAKQK